MASSVLNFVIVGHEDHPIYEADLNVRDPAAKEERAQYLHQFVLHAALDAVDEQQWTTTNMHLGVVDRFHNLQPLNVAANVQVSAFVTAAQIRFLLLHDGRTDDAVRSFFRDVHEVYLKAMLNPFFTPTSPIQSLGFGQKIRALARQHFRVP